MVIATTIVTLTSARHPALRAGYRVVRTMFFPGTLPGSANRALTIDHHCRAVAVPIVRMPINHLGLRMLMAWVRIHRARLHVNRTRLHIHHLWWVVMARLLVNHLRLLVNHLRLLVNHLRLLVNHLRLLIDHLLLGVNLWRIVGLCVNRLAINRLGVGHVKLDAGRRHAD